MRYMRKRTSSILTILSCLLAVPAFAGWQYSGEYLRDGWYVDDGARFVISARGGAAFGGGGVNNEIGGVVVGYYLLGGEPVTTEYCYLMGGCDGLDFAGYGDLGDLPASKDFEGFSFAAGASIGWTIPHKPQWRIEGGWDHISETDYNSSPMFQGDLSLVEGAVSSAYIQSSSVQSKVSTDVISVMAFYDFFDGLYKPIQQIIPYVGFGVGYADSQTVLNLSDPWVDISAQNEFKIYGVADEDYGLTVFYKSKYNTTNVAGLLAAGLSYGINETMFVDFGVRAMFLPRIKWELSNEDSSKHREFFSAENVFYVNAMLGLRFEF